MGMPLMRGSQNHYFVEGFPYRAWNVFGAGSTVAD